MLVWTKHPSSLKSNRQPQHVVMDVVAQNQSLLSVIVVILEKHATQLAILASAQNQFLHSVIAMIPLTSAIQNVTTDHQ
jgi:hypothetical protein